MAKTKKKTIFARKFRSVFERIYGEDQKKAFTRNSGLFSHDSVAKTTKQVFATESEPFWRFIVAYLSLKKEKKVAVRITIKGRGPGKMPWRAVGCRPLHYALRTAGVPKPGGMGDISPPIIWVWSTSASPRITCSGLHLSAGLHLNSENTSVPFLVKTFFFILVFT